jgi:hypothetical protein
VTQDPLIVRLFVGILGGTAAVLAWLGWLAVAPALGLPTLGAAALVNRDVASDENPGFWLGWLIVLLGLAAAVALYFLLADRLRNLGVGAGLLYGAALWLVAGAVVMPLLAWAEPAAAPPPPLPPGTPPPPQPPNPMHPSFMMLDLSAWAPVCAGVAWLLFGAILGTTYVRMRQEPA